jgi:hypothetical protein
LCERKRGGQQERGECVRKGRTGGEKEALVGEK